jgi:hypothetical protein
MIYYFCPDMSVRSSGIRLLYRHVDVLGRYGVPAAILHQNTGFTIDDMPSVPICYMDAEPILSSAGVVVIPEGFPRIMGVFRDHRIRRIAIALNWRYIFRALPDGVDWRDLGIERVLTNSPWIAEMVSWSMRMPIHVFQWGLRRDSYYYDPAAKMPKVVFLDRKKAELPECVRLLFSRNPDFVRRIVWKGVRDLS